jgi:hypothetical protein
MRLPFKFNFIYAFLLLLATQLYGQVKEGIVVYSLSYPEQNLDSASLKNLPDSGTICFKENRIRIDMQMGLGISNTIIADADTKEIHVLMDVQGSKTDMLLSEKQILKQREEDPIVTVSADTKYIAGYLCQKAIVQYKGSEMEVWFTRDIKVADLNWNNYLKGINGFPMEYTLLTGNLKAKMTAREVQLVVVPDEKFIIPSEYVKIDSGNRSK